MHDVLDAEASTSTDTIRPLSRQNRWGGGIFFG